MTSTDDTRLSLIVGAGAQGRVILDTWRQQFPSRTFAFLDDDTQLWGSDIDGAKVLGGISRLSLLEGEAVLAIGNNVVRRKLATAWKDVPIQWAKVIHPSAVVMPSASVAPGAVIFANAVVNTRASVGEHVVVNTGAIVEHDCILERFASVSPGVCMAGRVQVGEGAFLSTGATLCPRVRVGAGTVVGAGAVVVTDLPEGVLAYGVPARVVRELGPDFPWSRLL